MTAVANPAVWLAGYIADLPTPFDDDGGVDLAGLTTQLLQDTLPV